MRSMDMDRILIVEHHGLGQVGAMVGVPVDDRLLELLYQLQGSTP